MKFIVRDTDYAVRALVYMAKQSLRKNKKVFTVDEVVREEGLPGRFLRKLLQTLAKRGLLVSNKGKKGGFSFLKPPASIKLTDIMEVFQGRVDITNCLLKGRPCPNKKKCILRKTLKNINKLIQRELEKITVVSLLEGR
ncbi:MAG: Rrf2 family transcriptional regulator [Candidatus Omnitrophica bacterium]|nr:Rrf2 family transcriptional regulator [Candidatus Omnitrophota bacterium]